MTVAGGRTDILAPSPAEVTKFHINSDVDGSPKAQHHTLGPGPNQAAAGNHSHDGGGSTTIDFSTLTASDVSTALANSPIPWIALPFSGGWTDYATGFQLCAYRLVGDEVQVRGMMKHATTTTTGAFATLPVGYRPSLAVQFIGIASGPGIADLRVNTAGVMTVSYGTGGSGASVALWTIRFSIL